MIRKLVKASVALGLHATFHATRSDRLLRKLIGLTQPLIASYHRTVEEFPTDQRRGIPSICISTKPLERQLDLIARSFRLVTLDELGQRMEAGEPAGNLAAITFDDGYRDFYQHAFPILKRKS